MNKVVLVVLIAALSAMSGALDAQNGPSMQAMTGMKMSATDTKGMTGSHVMTGTVTSLDASTGAIAVNSDGMALKLHFPPSSLVDVKVGDKIQLQLAFKKL